MDTRQISNVCLKFGLKDYQARTHLLFLTGMTREKMANELSVSADTISKRLAAARKKVSDEELRRYLLGNSNTTKDNGMDSAWLLQRKYSVRSKTMGNRLIEHTHYDLVVPDSKHMSDGNYSFYQTLNKCSEYDKEMPFTAHLKAKEDLLYGIWEHPDGNKVGTALLKRSNGTLYSGASMGFDREDVPTTTDWLWLLVSGYSSEDDILGKDLRPLEEIAAIFFKCEMLGKPAVLGDLLTEVLDDD